MRSPDSRTPIGWVRSSVVDIQFTAFLRLMVSILVWSSASRFRAAISGRPILDPLTYRYSAQVFLVATLCWFVMRNVPWYPAMLG